VETAVSVALCTHNGARYVGAQLRSILGQTRPVMEVIVSDDGSADDTVEIVRRVFAEAGHAGAGVPPLILIQNERAIGVTANFAGAVAACRGSLIVLSDQDDVWHADRIERAVREFELRPELTLLNSDARIVDECGEPTGATLLESLELSPEDRATIHAGEGFDVLIRRNVVTGATTMFRRELLDSALPFPSEWVHDEWLAVIASAVGRTDFVEGSLIDYRRHERNQIGVRDPSLRHKMRRVLEPRGQRNIGLADRSQILADRLVDLAPAASRRTIERASGKARFERERAEFPRNRARRVVPVIRQAVTGGYKTYASQGVLDILRDLLQPDPRTAGGVTP
jgi:glycosyltransferase involved in cell wall biosynthesis